MSTTTTLSARRLRQFNEAVLELYRHTETGLPVQALVRTVRKLVPHTWTSVDELVAAEGVVVHRGGKDLEIFTHLAEAQRAFGTGNPNVRYFLDNGGSTDVVKWSDLISRPKLHDTAFYQEVVRDVCMEDQLALVTKVRTGSIGVALCGERTFSDEDSLVLSLLQPHISQVINRGLLYENLSPAEPLTAREREVLHWLAEGKRDSEISVILRISTRTVEQHVRRILVKLQVETRTGAAVAAWRARMPR